MSVHKNWGFWQCINYGCLLVKIPAIAEFRHLKWGNYIGSVSIILKSENDDCATMASRLFHIFDAHVYIFGVRGICLSCAEVGRVKLNQNYIYVL